MRIIEVRIGLDDAFGRAVARGIVRYAKTRGDWKLYGAVRRDFGSGPAGTELAGTEQRRPQGVIARVEDSREALALSALGVPVVDVAGAYPDAGPRGSFWYEANNDDFLTGRRAGEYLRRLGFRRCAFCGVEGADWSAQRKRGFVEASGVAEAALPRFERPLDWWKDLDRGAADLRAFLAGLGGPAALFACNDVAGLKTAEACRAAGLPVPERIAVLGVDDEDLLCELADPSLSSVRLDCEGIGRAAAQLLDQALGGETEERRRMVAPGQVIERQSTRTLHAEDELAARAFSWIRANAAKGANAGDLAAAFPVSRRTLEKRCGAAWGTTLHAALAEARLDQARLLLASGDQTLDEVAEESGFGSLQRFHLAFKRREGISPGAWRRENRRRHR